MCDLLVCDKVIIDLNNIFDDDGFGFLINFIFVII